MFYPSDACGRHFVLLEDAVVVILDVVCAVVPVARYHTRVPYTFLLEVALHPVSFRVHNLTSRCAIRSRLPHRRRLCVGPNASASTSASTSTSSSRRRRRRYRFCATATGTALSIADCTRSLKSEYKMDGGGDGDGDGDGDSDGDVSR